MHLPPCREPSGRLNRPGSSVSPLSSRVRDKDRILYGLSILLMAASIAGEKKNPCQAGRGRKELIMEILSIIILTFFAVNALIRFTIFIVFSLNKRRNKMWIKELTKMVIATCLINYLTPIETCALSIIIILSLAIVFVSSAYSHLICLIYSSYSQENVFSALDTEAYKKATSYFYGMEEFGEITTSPRRVDEKSNRTL